MSLNLYAELLLNLGRVSVFVTLPSPSNHTTRVSLSNDSRSIHILHDGQQARLDLPSQVVQDQALGNPALGITELSFRWQVADGNQHIRSGGGMKEQSTIWPATVLESSTEVACRSCKNVLVKDTVSTWNNLPSEDWAEMMDFWHCHKPDTQGTVIDQSKGSNKATQLLKL